MDNILRAEEALALEAARLDERRSQDRRRGLTIWGFSFFSILVMLILGVSYNAHTELALGVAGLIVAVFYGLFVSSGLFVSYEAYTAAETNLEKTQEAWLQSHGIELPIGTLVSLDFPTAAPSTDTTYGVADVVTRGPQSSLLTVVLSYKTGVGYLLRSTDGKLLEPLTGSAKS